MRQRLGTASSALREQGSGLADEQSRSLAESVFLTHDAMIPLT